MRIRKFLKRQRDALATVVQGGRDKSKHPGLRLYYWLTVVNVSKRAETLWKCSSDLKEHFHKVSSHLVSSRKAIGTAHPIRVAHDVQNTHVRCSNDFYMTQISHFCNNTSKNTWLKWIGTLIQYPTEFGFEII